LLKLMTHMLLETGLNFVATIVVKFYFRLV